MSSEHAHRFALLLEQLSQSLMTSAMCVQKLQQAFAPFIAAPILLSDDRYDVPFLDRSRWLLIWDVKTCKLGPTVSFRLAEKLSQKPNRFISAEQLLEHVWDGDERSSETLRSAVRNLRRRLETAGMVKLAEAIRSCGDGYGMMLEEIPRA